MKYPNNDFPENVQDFFTGKCLYFPCHKDMDDCVFCYCPLYPCGKNYRGGKMITSKSGKEIWDCSDCNKVHQKKVVDRFFKFFARKKN